ncbi:portal protein [Klebsiella aerogenes]
MAKISEDELLFHLERAYVDAQCEVADLDARHAISYDYYQARAPKKVNDWETSAVPVMRTAVNNLLSQLVPMFTSDEKSVVKVKAVDGKMPQTIADALTKAINAVALSDNQVRRLYTDMLTEMLVFGDTFTKVHRYERIKNTFTDTFEDMPEAELEMWIKQLLELGYAEQDIVIDHEPTVKTIYKKEREKIASDTGVPLALVPKKITTVTGSIKAILREKNIKIEMLPFEECYVPSRYRGDVSQSHYFCHEQTVRKDVLIAEGFDKDSVEQATGVSDRSPQAFNAGRTTSINENDYSEHDDYCDYAVIQEHYWRGIYDGKEEALYKITTCKNATILMKRNGKVDIERIDFIPVQNGKCMSMPAEFWGQSLFDLLAPLQDAKTRLQRAIVQNAEMAANGSYTAMKGMVDKRSLESAGRPGAVVEVSQPNAIDLFPYHQLPNSAMELDNQLDNEIKAIVNGALGANELTEQMANMSGTAIALLQSQDKTASMTLAHTIAETLFKPMYTALLALMQEIGHPLVIEGKAFDMKMLPNDLEFIVDIDTADDDATKAQNLMNFLSTAIQQNGGLPKFITEDDLYNIYSYYLEVATGQGDVSEYLTAPEDLPPPSHVQQLMELLNVKQSIYASQIAEAGVTKVKADIEKTLAEAGKTTAEIQQTLADIDNSKVDMVLKNKAVEVDEFNAVVNAKAKGLDAINKEQQAANDALRTASDMLETASTINKAQWEMTEELALSA